MGSVPGTVIAHIPAKEERYIGSPAIVRAPGGVLIAAHDVFGPASGFDTTHVYASLDEGVTWALLAELNGQFWSSLFVHDGALHLLGTARQFGELVIRRSDDGGRSWSVPDGERTGLLRRGRYHTAPTPVVVHGGRVWRGVERIDDEGEVVWGRSFRAGMISAPVDADLLDAHSWRETEYLPSRTEWIDPPLVAWLEGNAVPGPDGTMLDLLRVDFPVSDEALVAVAEVSGDGGGIRFDPDSGFRAMPGAISKFTVRFDETSGCYWALVNHVTRPELASTGLRARNELVLVSSEDLVAWRTGPSVLAHTEDDAHHAFQYVDWVVDDGDLLVVSRTAFDDDDGGAANFHDSNFLTFHRVEDFRQHGR